MSGLDIRLSILYKNWFVFIFSLIFEVGSGDGTGVESIELTDLGAQLTAQGEGDSVV
jgi:hypothetical protein